jgi:hypothetical protein
MKISLDTKNTKHVTGHYKYFLSLNRSIDAVTFTDFQVTELEDNNKMGVTKICYKIFF